jgi:hypothetical protein
MGSPEHLHGEVPEPGKGNEASMFFVDDGGRTSGHEVCAFSICWDWKSLLFLVVVPETVGRVSSFFWFRKELLSFLRDN